MHYIMESISVTLIKKWGEIKRIEMTKLSRSIENQHKHKHKITNGSAPRLGIV